MKLRRTAGRISLAVAMMMALIVPQATAVSAWVTGSAASTSGAIVYNTDTANDHLFTSTIYIYTGSGSQHSLVNKSGPNTTVNKTAGGTVTSVKACRAKPIGGMTCSTWNGGL